MCFHRVVPHKLPILQVAHVHNYTAYVDPNPSSRQCLNPMTLYKCSSHPGCKRVASCLARTTKFSLQHLHNNIDLHNRQREQAVSSQTNTGVDRCRQVTPHTAAALCVCITNTCADRQAGTCMHAQNVHQLW